MEKITSLSQLDQCWSLEPEDVGIFFVLRRGHVPMWLEGGTVWAQLRGRKVYVASLQKGLETSRRDENAFG